MVTIQYKGHEIEILPERGAIISSWKYNGEDVLYEDSSHYRDHTIRGGMPILFPICGKVENDCVSFNGKTFKMHRHGFARDYQWEVIRCEEASVTLQLQSNQQTFAQYPYHFKLEVEYKVSAEGLTVTSQVWNLNNEEMPYQIGFHPYFFMKDKKASSFQYNWHEEVNDCILNESSMKVDLEKVNIQVNIAEPFDRFVIWSLPDAPFICVEPWIGGVDSLNDSHPHHLKEQQSKIHQFTITIG